MQAFKIWIVIPYWGQTQMLLLLVAEILGEIVLFRIGSFVKNKPVLVAEILGETVLPGIGLCVENKPVLAAEI
jgi:hypothetical protein